MVWFGYISHLCSGEGDFIFLPSLKSTCKSCLPIPYRGEGVNICLYTFEAVLRIRIRRIHMFLGLWDPDPLVRDTDPDRLRIWILLSSSKKSKKNIDSFCFVTFFLSLNNYVNVLSKTNKPKKLDVLKVTDENSRIPLVRGMDPRIRVRNTLKLLRLEDDCYDAYVIFFRSSGSGNTGKGCWLSSGSESASWQSSGSGNGNAWPLKCGNGFFR